MNEIFFSYAWNDKDDPEEDREEIVDQLYRSLKSDGYNVIRDKYDVGYKGFFSDFTKRIGKGKTIIVAISKKYVRSAYCMFELYEIARNSNFDKTLFHQKVFPIIVEFIEFNKPEVLNEYLSFWQSELNKWNELIKRRSNELSAEQFQRYETIKMIYQNFGKLADWLIDMNALNPPQLSKENFKEIKQAIQKNIKITQRNDEERSTLSEEERDDRIGKAFHLSKLIGLLFMAAGIAMVTLIKCPTSAQLFILYALTGLGIAFLFIKNAGKINAEFKMRNISVILSGGIALPFILFFTNPVGAFKSNDCNFPISVSVFVHGKKSRQDMILRKQGHVVMDLKGGERKKADISENGVAYFQNLHVGDSVNLEVDFSEPYKSICPDSTFVINADGRIYLPIALQGINQVKGRVLYNDAPLGGVMVTIGMLTDTTDENGRYQIDIPEEQQKQEYEVWFNKKGFKARPATAYPQTGEDLNIVMEK